MKKILKIKLSALILGFAAIVMSVPGEASYRIAADDRSRDDYGVGMTRKLGRGVANTGLGWVEVFKGVQDVGEEDGFWAGATWGPIYGTLNAVRRTAVGLYETATFPVANPDHFEPILQPEFVMQQDNS